VAGEEGEEMAGISLGWRQLKAESVHIAGSSLAESVSEQNMAIK
jgi:hypothetical protein